MYKKFVAAFIALFATLTLASTSHAEIKTYEGVGEYYLTEETVDYAKQQAKLEAERSISEQVYVYIHSIIESKGQVFDHDEIVMVTESLMKIVDVKYDIRPGEDETFVVRAEVKAEVDTDDIEKINKQR